jgi:hypothetical protein
MGERRGARSGQPRGSGSSGGVGGLTGGGPSIVGVVGAMRARDVSRPRPADEERAAKTLVVKRRTEEPKP